MSSDTTSELRQKILTIVREWAESYEEVQFEAQTDELLALLAAQKQRWEAEARLAENRIYEVALLTDWERDTGHKVLGTQEDLLKMVQGRIAALDGVITEKNSDSDSPVESAS